MLKRSKIQNANHSSNEFLPRTKVVEFDITNNFHVQSFSSYHTKFGEKFKNNVYRVISFEFKFEFLTFKRSFK